MSDLAVPLTSFPDPALRYEIRDGTPVIAATNDAFESAFDVREGAPVTAAFERFAVENAGDRGVEARLRDGDAADLYLGPAGDGAAYFVRAIPAAEGGALLFTDAGAWRDLDGRAGIGAVATAISHDLRNPLDVAAAHLHAARESGAEEHFDAVAEAHDRMERIIRDVLTLARGDEALAPSPSVSVHDAAERAWETVDSGDATIRMADPLPTATADADRLRRLFENLFRNSVEHASTPADDGVTVTIGALPNAEGIYVADDGPGIPEAERESVFEPGYTVDGGGTGLGLAIVRRIADAHGWAIAIADGDGARIEIRFGP